MLYLKELKTIVIPSLLLAVTYGFMTVYFSLIDISEHRSTFQFASGIERNVNEFPALMLYSALIVLPIILSYSLYIEWSVKTSHQLMTLPVPRYKALLGKHLAVATVGAMLIAVITVFQRIWEVKLLAEFPIRYYIADPFLFAVSGVFLMAWLLGMVALIYGLMLYLRRLELWIGIVLFGFLFELSIMSMSAITPYVLDAAGISKVVRVPGYGMYHNEYVEFVEYGWLCFLGVVFLIAGLFVFHHRGES